MRIKPIACSGHVGRRLISSSSRLSAITPESPSWIEIPEPLQAPKPPKPPIKGILPIPRKILADTRHKYKATNKHLDKTAPHPRRQRQLDLNNERADQNLFNRELSSQRRDLLREGIKGIMDRRISEAHKDHSARWLKSTEDKEARERPDRRDEVLTRQSVPEVVRKALAWKPLPKHESKQLREERIERYQDSVAARNAYKMRCIHNLYMNARNFIVDPEALNTKIESVFGADDNPVHWQGAGFATSIWAVGQPAGTSGLINPLGLPKKKGENPEGWTTVRKEQEAMRKRIATIAGELSGGKLDESENMADR